MHRSAHPLLVQLRARPRLYVAILVAILVGAGLRAFGVGPAVTRWLIAWNSGTILYVVLAGSMMLRSTQHSMRQRARQSDGQRVILALVAIGTLASLAAIAWELATVKDLQGLQKTQHVVIAGLTVLSSWAFTQVSFALHYAHEYYGAAHHGRSPGLQFPGDDDPDYGDFFYFSAVIGTSGQTADVSFVSRRMRRIGTLHCILAYLFNTTVLALLINIGASLF